jgi:hypothetical protein
MSVSNSLAIKRQLERTVGPSPWYWKTFPSIIGSSGREFVWTHHGDQGAMAYVVSLSAPEQTEKPVLVLNTYCRPFIVPPSYLGVWSPEGRNIRLACFDPAALKEFDIAEVAGWFKQSSDRIYSATPPIADFEVSPLLGAGTHKIEVPEQLRTVDELIVPTSYPAKSNDDPAFALYVFYLRAGLVEVLPQRWFTASQYQVGKQWITRAARDPETQRIIGECFGAGIFQLEADGCRLDRWLEKNP